MDHRTDMTLEKRIKLGLVINCMGLSAQSIARTEVFLLS